MTLEEALKAFKDNSVSTKALIQMLENRVGNIEKNIESYRRDINEWEQRIEAEKIKIKEDKVILEAFKTLVNN